MWLIPLRYFSSLTILAKTGHGPPSSLIVLFHVLIVLFYVFFVSSVLFMYCLCVNVYYCHRVPIQLQLNISYRILLWGLTYIKELWGTYVNMTSFWISHWDVRTGVTNPFLTLGSGWGSSQLYASPYLSRGEIPRNPLERWLVGLQTRPG